VATTARDWAELMFDAFTTVAPAGVWTRPLGSTTWAEAAEARIMMSANIVKSGPKLNFNLTNL